PESRPGSLVELTVPSRALRRACRVTLYLPARFRRIASYPLLIVHDGGDYLKYAAAQTVLDNLIHRLDVAEAIVALLYPGRPAGRVRHPRGARALPDRRARAAARGGIPAGQRPVRAVPDGRELRRRRGPVHRVPLPGRLRVAAAPVRLVRVHRHRPRPRW